VVDDLAILERRCELLRSLHIAGDPLVLPNAWDVGSARAVVAAGFPVVATTSGGVADSLGYEDHEGAPGGEMLAAAARISRAVDVPVTVDAEAGYGLEPAELVAALRVAGAAGCNLEDTDHATESLRDTRLHAEWLRAVRDAATTEGYGLVVNARIDVFLTGSGSVTEALERAAAYFDAGVDCVYPIVLAERDALNRFVSEAGGPVNILALPHAPSVDELAALGVARVSYGSLLYRQTLAQFEREVAALQRSP
jgi:2-methylisocitrate lyase-like PEP mutase family enzyme